MARLQKDLSFLLFCSGVYATQGAKELSDN